MTSRNSGPPKRPTEYPTMGRPRLPEAMRRDQRVVSFLTDDEFERLQERAAAEGLTLSATIHQILSRSLRTRTRASGATRTPKGTR